MKLENMSTAQLLLEIIERLDAVKHQFNDDKKYAQPEVRERLDNGLKTISDIRPSVKELLHGEIDR